MPELRVKPQQALGIIPIDCSVEGERILAERCKCLDIFGDARVRRSDYRIETASLCSFTAFHGDWIAVIRSNIHGRLCVWLRVSPLSPLPFLRKLIPLNYRFIHRTSILTQNTCSKTARLHSYTLHLAKGLQKEQQPERKQLISYNPRNESLCVCAGMYTHQHNATRTDTCIVDHERVIRRDQCDLVSPCR